MTASVTCIVAGAGAWGAILAEHIERGEGLSLAGVVDPADGNGRNTSWRRYTGLAEALADPAITAVVVATPNDTHAQLALEAVRAGRHVLLEKPAALTVAELEPLAAEATRRRLVVMPNHVMRYYEPIAEVERLVAGGVVGRPLALRVERRDHLRRTTPWLQQRDRVGGLLFQSTCHELDILRWLAGDVVEVGARAAAVRIAPEPLDYPDLIQLDLRFASGAIGQVWSCMSDPTLGYGGVVTGSQGTITFDLYDAKVTWRRLDGGAGERNWTPADQWSPAAWMRDGGIGAGESAALAALLSDFRDACQGRAPAPIGLTDAIATTELAQAGYRALAGGGPVALPLSSGERAARPYLELPAPEHA